MSNRLFEMKFKELYKLYIEKALKKNRSLEEVNKIITWLTSYSEEEIIKLSKTDISFGDFFKNAKLNEKRYLITGTICKVKLEDLEDGLLKDIRILDKLIDELSKGKDISKILL